MVFKESPLFTKWAKEILSDDELRHFQNELLLNPELGDVIRGTGGLRKARIAYGGQGKCGAGRVIYFRYVSEEVIYLLLGFSKNQQSDLSSNQRKILRHLMESD